MNLTNLSTQTKAIVAGALVVTGAFLYVYWRDRQAERSGEKIEALEAENNRLGGRLEGYVGEIYVLKEKVAKKEADIGKLRSDLAALPKPKPHVPLPPEPEGQVQFFKGYGLNPLVVPGGVGSLAFPSVDLPVLSRSLQDSANLPGVQRELSDTQRLVEELDSLDRLKTERIAKTDEALATSREQTRVTQAEIDEYRKKLRATERKSKVSRILWGIAGVGVGVLIRK